MDYQYPIEYDWSTEEIIDVIAFFQHLEKAYDKGILKEELLASYRRFKEIVPGKAQERKICDEFEQVSGFSSYRTLMMLKEKNDGEIIKMS